MMQSKFCENVAFLLALNGALSMTLCLPTKHWSTAEPAVFLTPSQEPGRVLMFNWWACRGCLLSEPVLNFSEHYSFPRPNTRERKHGSSAHPGWLSPSSCRHHLQRHCCLHLFPRYATRNAERNSHVFPKRRTSLNVTTGVLFAECCEILRMAAISKQRFVFFCSLCLSTKTNPKRQGLWVCFTVH